MPDKNGNNTKMETQVAVILNDVGHIREEITNLKVEIREDRDENNKSMVRREEFEPVQKIVYGLVGLILVAVVGAIIALVVTSPPT